MRTHESVLFIKMLLLGYWICAVFIAQAAVSGDDVFGALGGTVSFRPTNMIPHVTSIIWKHKSSSGIVVKAIEWDDDGFNIPNQRFKGITTLNNETGEITITDLTVNHSGVYTIDINSKEQEQRFTLEVMVPVPKPVIKIEKISVNPNAVYLICEYSETVTWKNSSGGILKGSPHTPQGELIKVEKKGNPENYYTCTLKNAVKEETSDPVYERDLFEADIQPWWILIVVLILMILAGPIVMYKVFGPFHGFVYKHLGGKPCIGVVLDGLDCKKKDKPPEAGAPSSSEPLKENGDGGDRDDKL